MRLLSKRPDRRHLHHDETWHTVPGQLTSIADTRPNLGAEYFSRTACWAAAGAVDIVMKSAEISGRKLSTVWRV